MNSSKLSPPRIQSSPGNYYKGFLRFYLNGAKLKGEWILQRFANGKDERDTRDKWYLIKSNKNTRGFAAGCEAGPDPPHV